MTEPRPDPPTRTWSYAPAPVESTRDQRAARRGYDLRAGIGAGVALVGLLVALVIATHILLVVFDATPGNAVVTFFRHATDFLDGSFHRLFLLDTHKKQIAVNDGLAAASYLLVGVFAGRKIRP